MGIPVKLKVDGFVYMGEEFAKGDVFDAPNEMFACYLCDQEGQATRIDESKLEPEKGGTMKRTKKGSYDTKVMEPKKVADDTVPTITKSKPRSNKPGANNKQASNVKAKSDAASENT